MASRGVANMHLFLQMKQQFPELPEDVIRKSIHEWSGDHKKCLQCLYKECENYGHKQLLPLHSQVPVNNKMHANRNYLHSSKYSHERRSKEDPTYKNNLKHSEMVIFVNHNSKHSILPEASSQISSSTKAVSVLYKDHTFPNQTLKFPCKPQSTRSFANNVQCNNSTFNSEIFYSSHSATASKRHKVMLSFTPTSPCQQISNVPVHGISSHISSHGQHVTSVHLQLKPNKSCQPLVRISAAADRLGTSSSSSKQYNSCVQICFSPESTTFSAQRTNAIQRNSESTTLTSKINRTASSPESKTVKKVNQFLISDPSKIDHNSYTEVPNPKCGDFEKSSQLCNFILQNDSLQSNSPTKYLAMCNARISEAHLSEQNKNLSTEVQPHVQAVINHQKVRLEILRKEFMKEHALYTELKEDIQVLEKELYEIQHKEHNPFFSDAAKNKLIYENRKLDDECNFLRVQVKSRKVQSE